MSEKKMVRRSVAVTLGIICIILIVGLGLAMAYYTNYVSTHSRTDSDYNSLNSENMNLQNQVNDLSSSLSLGKFTVWISSQTVSSPYNSYYSWTPLSVDYAGYVSVNVESSTSTHTYVHAIYSAYGVHYDQWIDVGKSGTTVFPVLPTSSMGIYVGAHYEASTVTVTITYHY